MTRARPEPSSPAASERMKATGGRDTKPELRLRSLLHRMGLRYRVDQPVLAGTRRRADLVFKRARVAVFVDGCFWHGCTEHKTIPKANREFWLEKITTNRTRDADTDRRLGEQGWKSVRIWEHDVSEATARRIATLVQTRMTTSS